MKKLIVALAAIMVTVTSFGQGAIVFNNRVTGTVDAPIKLASDPTKGPGADTGWLAQLYLIAAGGAATPLTPATTFRPPNPANANPNATTFYVVGQDVLIPGTNPGDTVNLQLRAFKGTDFGSAGDKVGQSAIFSQKLGGGTLPPESLANLTGFSVNDATTVTPEPATIALAILGAGALFIRRRK